MMLPLPSKEILLLNCKMLNFELEFFRFIMSSAPDKLRICIFYAVKTHVLSDQSVHITHINCCVSKLSKFGAYLYAVNDNTVVYINNTFLSLRNSP
jgi:hypothetical protein